MGEKDQDGKHVVVGVHVDEFDPTQFINETRVKGVEGISEDSIASQEIHYLMRGEDMIGQRLGEYGIHDVVQSDQADAAGVYVGINLRDVDLLGKGVVDVAVFGLHSHKFLC